MDIISILDKITSKERLESIKKSVLELSKKVESHTEKTINYSFNNGDHQSIRREFLLRELKQILETRTIERTKYYLNRLIKSLSVEKAGKINDLNLNRWKEYEDIITDSLWIFDKRDTSGMHKAGYWGNFIPQIPNQLLRRYSKKGEWVLDPFLGSGTTLIECKRLGRNGIGIELNDQVANATRVTISKEKNPFKVTTKVIRGDSRNIDQKSLFKKLKVESFQFLIMHPPYWDIIKFSNDKDDLSNARSTRDFLGMFRKVADNFYPILDKGRYCAGKCKGQRGGDLCFYRIRLPGGYCKIATRNSFRRTRPGFEIYSLCLTRKSLSLSETLGRIKSNV